MAMVHAELLLILYTFATTTMNPSVKLCFCYQRMEEILKGDLTYIFFQFFPQAFYKLRITTRSFQSKLPSPFVQSEASSILLHTVQEATDTLDIRVVNVNVNR